ncbi:MAG: YkvA family protein [Thermosynechococcus sp.]|uniref:YkvA family protein n=1 Tax=Thermosynechococcus sp. TaxID=2814275 RepID=UPI003918CB78
MSSFYNWYRNLLRHPKYRWLIIAASLIYLLSPLDISPDLVPILGQLDDVTVMVILASELTQLLVERVKSRRSPNLTTTVDVEAEQV